MARSYLYRTKFQADNSPTHVAVSNDAFDVIGAPNVVECNVRYDSKSLLGHALSFLPKPTLSVGWALILLFATPYVIATISAVPTTIAPAVLNAVFYFGIAAGITLIICSALAMFGCARLLGMFEPNSIHLDHRGLKFVFSPGIFGSTPVIPWNNIDSVVAATIKGAFGEQKAIVIEASGNYLSPLQKVCLNFLRPLFAVSTSNQIKITLKEDLIAQQDRERLLSVMEAYVEPAKLDQALFTAPEEPAEIVPYRAARSFRKMLKKLLQSESRLTNALYVVASLCAICVLFIHHKSMMYLGGAIGGGAALLWVWAQCATWYHASEILIRQKGLQLRCRVAGKSFVLPLIEWRHFVGAKLIEGGYRNQKQWAVLSGSKDTPMALRLMYLTFAKECRGWFVPWQLRFDFDCLSMKDRRELRKILSEKLGRSAIDLELSDALSPIDTASYTTLWLECLEASEPSRSRQEALTEGTTLGNDRYAITGSVGSGGQGTAYLATALDTGESVVLKEFILPAHGDLATRQKALDNVKREAELLGNLSHPQIVGFVDFFIDDLRAYLVLEHIDGQSLRHAVRDKGKLSEPETIELASQMCRILQYLHEQTPPVVHRDFTPENLILTKNGKIKLIDFNVALQLELESCTTKTVVGKHAYIPPEQFRGKATTASDIYALGATLYFMLTGKDPQPITSSHPANESQNVSEELNSLVATATALNSGERPANAQELEKALANLIKESNSRV